MSHRSVLAASVVVVLMVVGAAFVGASEPARAAFPGTNGKIAFVDPALSSVEQTYIHTVNPDGSEQANLTIDMMGVETAEDPQWSADGERLVFAAWAQNQTFLFGDLWAMDADGSNKTKLTDDGATTWEHDPSWFPGGDRIAYVVNGGPSNNGGDLYALRLVPEGDSAERVRLTRTPNLLESDPVVSPDGHRIAFVGYSTVSGRQQVYVMRAEPRSPTNRPVRLTSGPRQGHSPDWSPDGQQIAFDRRGEIFIMDADGANKTRITRDPASGGGNPAFSPDGKQIAFVRAEAPTDPLEDYKFPNIWKMKVNGSDPTQVTAGFFSETDPDWQPLP